MQVSLYPIQQCHLSLLSIIESEDGILSPEIEQALSFTHEEFQQQAISVGFAAKDLEQTENVIDAEIDRLKKMKEAITKRNELVRKRLKEAMLQFGVEKIDSPTLKIGFRKSEQVIILDEAALAFPYKYTKTETTEITVVEKNAIRAAIKCGIDVPGAHLQINKNLQLK